MTIDELCALQAAMLKRLEWAGTDAYGHAACPVCEGCGRKQKHAPECGLAALLAMQDDALAWARRRVIELEELE